MFTFLPWCFQFLVEAEVYHRLTSSNSSVGASSTHTPMTDDSCDNLPNYTLLPSDTPRTRFSYHGDTANTYEEVIPQDRHSYQGHPRSPSHPAPSPLTSNLSIFDQTSSLANAASDKSLLSSLSTRSIQYENLTNSESHASLTSSASTMTAEVTRSETKFREEPKLLAEPRDAKSQADFYENARVEPNHYEPVAVDHLYDDVAPSVGVTEHSDSSSNNSGGYTYQALVSSAEMLSGNVYDDVAPEPQQTYENLPPPTPTPDQNIYEPISQYLHSIPSQAQKPTSLPLPSEGEQNDCNSNQVHSTTLEGENSDVAVVKEPVANINEAISQHTKDTRKVPANINTAAFDNTNSTNISSQEDPLSPTRLLILSLDENRRKFESEIGRDLVRDKKMRQELGANFSNSTTPTISDITSQFEWRKSTPGPGDTKPSLPPCLRARSNRSKQNPGLTTSLDSGTFPSDGTQGDLQRVITSPDLKEGEENNNHLEEADRRERIERYKEERRNYLRQKYKVDALKSEDDQKDEEMISRLKQKVKHPQSTTPTSTGSSVSLEDTLKSPTKTTVSILYTPTVSNTFIQDVPPCNALTNNNKENKSSSPLRRINKNEFTSSISKDKSGRPPICDKPLIIRELNKFPIQKSLTTSNVEKVGAKSASSFVAKRVNQLSGCSSVREREGKEQTTPAPANPAKLVVKCTSFSDPNQAKITYDRQRAHSVTSAPQPMCIRDMAAMFESKTK
ncbi:hypothetical protein M8J76_003245 [Diaphorina citri]|nr:hypothetical protein M8J76_003245 [Diaphorina citri]